MPAPTGTYNDGGIKFVRQTVTALDSAGANVTYVVKSGSLDRDVNRITSTNENNVENKQAFQLKIPTGSIELQFVAEADKPPKPLQAIALVDCNGAAVQVIIGKVSEKFGAGEEAMVTCDIYSAQA